MCVILRLPPKIMPTMDQVYNACYNNWHSFGLILKSSKRIEDVIREQPEKEIDPSVIYNLLADNAEFERFLHVRHNTAGATILENVHPFEVYNDGNKKNPHVIYFMHNGTLHEYKSKTASGMGTHMVDDDTGPSDSYNFATRELRPYLESDFGSGLGDVSNKLFQKTINRCWSGNNRGILISSRHEPFFIGEGRVTTDWKKIQGVGGEFLASNDDYFKEVTRGPEQARRRLREEEENRIRAEAARRAYAEQEREEGSSTNAAARESVVPTGATVTHIADFIKSKQARANLKIPSLTELFTGTEWEIWTPEGMTAVGLLKSAEIEKALENIDRLTLAMYFEYAFGEFARFYYENREILEKHDKATKKIASLMKELNELKSLNGIDAVEQEEEVRVG